MTESNQPTNISKDSNGDEKPQSQEIPKTSLVKLYSVGSTADRALLVLGGICSAISGALMPVMTVVFGRMINIFIDFQSSKIGRDEFQSNINSLTLFFIYLAIGVFVSTYIFMASYQWIGAKMTHKIRNMYLTSLLKQEISWFDKVGSGEVTTRISSDTNLVQDGISEKVALIIQDIATFVAAFVIAFVSSWRLSLILSCLIPVIGASLGGMMYFGIKYIMSALQKYSVAGNTAEECFSTIRTVMAFNLQSKMTKRYNDLLNFALKDSLTQAVIFTVGVNIMIFCTYCGYSLAFFYGARLINWGLADVGIIWTAFFAILLGAQALGNISPNMQSITKGQAAAAKLFECIDRVPEIDSSSTEGLKLDEVHGDIELKNIKFTYPSRKDVQIFDGFSLNIKAGQTVALVGASGSGKSTTIQLLERFYDPNSGDILLDGHSIKSLNLKWYRRQIGLVSQEPTLFNGTIADNIVSGLVGTPLFNAPMEKKMEAIIEACKHANAHDFISNLPLKYDTQVGERGFLLSGGQKQRIAIARAIVRNPRILLLDEATSALDTKSEVLVQKALDHVSENRTTIVIAHRLSTIRNANLIVVVEKGRIIEQGTHDSLLQNSNGTYYKLVKLQDIARKIEGEKEDQDNFESDDQVLSRQMSNDPAKMVETYLTNTKGSATSVNEAEETYHKYGFFRLAYKTLNVNKADIVPYIIGGLGSGLFGAIYPVFSIILASVLQTLSKSGQELLDGTDFWSLMFLIIAIAAFIFNATNMYHFGRSSQRLTLRLRSKTFSHILSQEAGWFDRKANSTGSLTSSLSADAQDIQGLDGATFGNLLQVFTNIVGSIIVGLVYGWKMCLVVCTCLPLLLGGGFFQIKLSRGFSEENKQAYSDSAELACEASGAVRTVASLTNEESVCEKYDTIMQIPLQSNFKKSVTLSSIFAASRSIEFLVSALAFWYGAQLVKSGEYNFQQMFTVYGAIVMSAGNASRIFAYLPDIHKAQKAAAAIFDILERVPLIDGISTTVGKVLSTSNADTPIQGHIKFDSVHFSYPTRPGARVLKGVNFEAKPGQFIALVGPSGCGKSTVISLLERFYEVTKGSVKIDGVDIRDYNLPTLRAHMALVSQEPSLYDMTIGENIAMGARNSTEPVTQDQIEAAAKQANLHNFVMSLPQGYKTNVGSKGTQLSGGQKQRVAIARALIRNPSILLLDEATSALDAESERVVQDALDAASVGRTTVAIAHRLSTIQKADIILVVQNHRIVESGSHQQLLNQRGVYFDMVNQQNLSIAT